MGTPFEGTSSNAHAGKANPRRRMQPWVIFAFLVFAAITIFYAVTAIETGRDNLAALSGNQLLQAREHLRAIALAPGSHGPGLGQVLGTVDPFIYVAQLFNPLHVMYGTHGFYDLLLYYAQMPKANVVVLSLHNMLGGTCMLLGALQFWPFLRRNYPRWHRAAGLIYMVSSQLAMIGAMTYMLRTPVRNMYDTLTFTSGLWFLAIGVTSTLWLSIYHLVRRDIAQHQAYMALNYGFLLTAPFTRIDWIGAAALFPNVSQYVSNTAAVAVLIAQCMLFGYLLLCMNRWLQQARPLNASPRPALPVAFTQALARVGVLVLSALSVVALLAVADHYLLAPGFDHFEAGRAWIANGVAELESGVLAASPVSRWIYALSAMGVCVLAPVLLWAAFVRKSAAPQPWVARLATLVGLLTAINGIALLYWSALLGGPTETTSSGGAPYLMNGAFEVFFAVLLLSGVVRKRHALIKEWSLFAVLCVLALPSFYALVPLIGWVDTLLGVPDLQAYVASGDIYRIGISVGLVQAMLIGSIYATYGSATQERFAR